MSITNDRYRILVVEDSLLAQTAVVMLLQSLGFQVTAVTTGQQALDAYQDCDGILLDIGLPDLSGIEVCKIIRSRVRGKHIPIIALTAHSNEKTIEDCLAAGFDTFIVKPLTEPVAKRVIKEYFIKPDKNDPSKQSKISGRKSSC